MGKKILTQILDYVSELLDKLIDKITDDSKFLHTVVVTTHRICDAYTQDKNNALYGCIARVKLYDKETCFANGYKEPTVEITMASLNKQTNWALGVESKTSFPLIEVYKNIEIEKYYNNILKPCLIALENDMKEKLGEKK